jgi:PAS domain S-box-containing protein
MRTIEDLKRVTEVPVVIANQLGTIQFLNPSFQREFGWREIDLVGRSLTVTIPENLRPAHHLGFSRFLTTAKATLLGQPLRLKIVTRDGSEVEAEHMIIAEKQSGEWFFGATITPLKAP